MRVHCFGVYAQVMAQGSVHLDSHYPIYDSELHLSSAAHIELYVTRDVIAPHLRDVTLED